MVSVSKRSIINKNVLVWKVRDTWGKFEKHQGLDDSKINLTDGLENLNTKAVQFYSSFRFEM